MRVAVVNDVKLAVELLSRVLKSDDHEVAWVAYDGLEAVEKCRQDQPDLILMDLVMPNMDGVATTRQIMAESPCPILIVTASVDRMSDRVFTALAAGAMDAVDTPALGISGSQGGRDALCRKINQIARLVGKGNGKAHKVQAAKRDTPKKWHPLIAIGASSGGPGALATLLGGLKPDLQAGVVIIQHIDPGFTQELVNWLDKQTELPVSLARSGQRIETGKVVVADTVGHLIVASTGVLAYTQSPEGLLYRPSVDVFFESAANHWAGTIQGVLLTGMGADGARGLLGLKKLGHKTVVQDKETSPIFGMPRAAIEMGAAQFILPIQEMAQIIQKNLRTSSGRNAQL